MGARERGLKLPLNSMNPKFSDKIRQNSFLENRGFGADWILFRAYTPARKDNIYTFMLSE